MKVTNGMQMCPFAFPYCYHSDSDLEGENVAFMRTLKFSTKFQKKSQVLSAIGDEETQWFSNLFQLRHSTCFHDAAIQPSTNTHTSPSVLMTKQDHYCFVVI